MVHTEKFNREHYIKGQGLAQLFPLANSYLSDFTHKITVQ